MKRLIAILGIIVILIVSLISAGATWFEAVQVVGVLVLICLVVMLFTYLIKLL